jgi:AcrR family transcriptional regulator
MPRKTNRQELIVIKATELFMAQGYKTTTVRQIAEAAGCTDAALYYHFPQGKRSLFQAVLECNMPDFLALLEPCRQANSLQELIPALGQNIDLDSPLWDRVRWLMTEFTHLSADEKELAQQAYLAFHTELLKLVQRFVPDKAHASMITWLVICALLGYIQTFLNLEMGKIVPLPIDRFKEILAQLLER